MIAAALSLSLRLLLQISFASVSVPMYNRCAKD